MLMGGGAERERNNCTELGHFMFSMKLPWIQFVLSYFVNNSLHCIRWSRGCPHEYRIHYWRKPERPSSLVMNAFLTKLKVMESNYSPVLPCFSIPGHLWNKDADLQKSLCIHEKSSGSSPWGSGYEADTHLGALPLSCAPSLMCKSLVE